MTSLYRLNLVQRMSEKVDDEQEGVSGPDIVKQGELATHIYALIDLL